jgi:glycine cleavage system P protein (glycine dehydrogenase) subunit 1
MSYIPHTDQDRGAMLAAIGVPAIEDLYASIPEAVRFPALDLPPASNEMDVLREMESLAQTNADAKRYACFLGAGAYNHYIPSVVDHILRRSEFYTAYTPYQPEISQGTLQAVFEFQSLICQLTGMDVANASLYDGATALAEAVSMALSHHRHTRSKVVLSPAIHPHFRETVRTYMRGEKVDLVEGDSLELDLQTLIAQIDDQTALVAVQYPDVFGRIADYEPLGEACRAAGALFCVVVNPMALGMLKPPSAFGADVVVGEGQPLGVPLSYGGPYLGLFATRQEYVRKMPGRLVGETSDSRGQRGYVLTLTPREQHIRREKATSNICTNQGLIALAATVYLTVVGKQGLRQAAELSYHKAHYAAEAIGRLPGYSRWGESPFFNEFAVKLPRPVDDINRGLLAHHILGGFDLGQWYPQMEGHMLLAVTERNTRAEIDALVEALKELGHE